MNKNPFVPQPSYPTPQPPLPPGPPPTTASQPGYVPAYWTAAAAGQTQTSQPQYNGQWTAPTAPTPVQPPAEQSSLYANYGYGGQWQQQQQRAHQPQAAPATYPQPPPLPTTPYNPYQPQAAYPQPYAAPPPIPIPQAAPPMSQQPFPVASQQQQRPPYFPQQQHQQPQRHAVHHTPPQHMPPAKRPRFDSGVRQQPGPPPPQPQFQPPPPPPGSMIPQGVNNSSFNVGRGGAPGPMGRGGMQGGHGGPRNRGGGPMGSARGGASSRGHRGSGSFNRGGGQGGGYLKPHGSRGNFGQKDFSNRRSGGSVNHGQHHQYQHQGGSFRGRNNYQNYPHKGRHDGSFSYRDGGSSSSGFLASGSSKKEDSRRTLTDFKIIGLEIRDIGWTWGVLPTPKTAASDTVSAPVEGEANEAKEAGDAPSSDVAPTAPSTQEAGGEERSAVKQEESTPGAEVVSSQAPTEASVSSQSMATPPCRMRIYFHSPVTAEDARPIPHGAGMVFPQEDGGSRKGKRKKLEDDDGDADERRAPPPPPGDHHERDVSVDIHDRESAAPSVAETTSEGDWLMAAIGEDAENGEGEDDDVDAEGEADGDGDGDLGLHVTEIHEGDTYESQGQGGGDVGTSHDELGTAESGQNGHDEIRNAQSPGSSDLTGTATLEVTELPLTGVAHPEQKPGESAASSAATDTPQSTVSPSSSASIQPNGSTLSHEALASAPMHALEHGALTGEDLTNHTHSAETQDVSADLEEAGGTQVDGHEASFEGSTLASILDSSSTPSTVATYGELNSLPLPPKEDGPPVARTPSANRVSISYASGTKRLVIDAEVVHKLKLFRSEGRIEILMKLEHTEQHELRGILVEGLSEATKLFEALEILTAAAEVDSTVPPFSKATIPCDVTFNVYLDTERPLSEPRWAKTGDIQEWLKSILGRMFWVAGDAAEGWEKKIEIVDPDPAPTIWTVLDTWANVATIGTQTERQRFVRTHVTEPENMLEILLRLVRGERATTFQNSSALSPSNVSGPLLAALSSGSTAHNAQQTHVSLAVLAMFHVAIEYAERAAGSGGKAEAQERVWEIIRNLPSHLLYKSLEGIFKEWKTEMRGGGR